MIDSNPAIARIVTTISCVAVMISLSPTSSIRQRGYIVQKGTTTSPVTRLDNHILLLLLLLLVKYLSILRTFMTKSTKSPSFVSLFCILFSTHFLKLQNAETLQFLRKFRRQNIKTRKIKKQNEK
jgi:hypothetical protein